MSLDRRSFLIAAAGLVAGCASSPPDNVANACAIFQQKRGWFRATRRAEKRWGAPMALQLAIIGQESAFDANAKPARGRFLFVFPGARASSARGFPQAIEATWEQYQRATGNAGASRQNFRDAADFVGWYLDQSARRLGISKSDAYRQYLAYHEGWGGYARASFRDKPALLSTARRVADTATRYDRQLGRCGRKYRKRIKLT